jgi:hypothetical protein
MTLWAVDKITTPAKTHPRKFGQRDDINTMCWIEKYHPG